MSYEPQLADIIETWVKENFKYVEFSFKGQLHIRVQKYKHPIVGVKQLVRTVMICPMTYENKIVFKVNNHGYYGHGPNRNFHVMAEFDIRDPECFSKMYDKLTELGMNLK